MTTVQSAANGQATGDVIISLSQDLADKLKDIIEKDSKACPKLRRRISPLDCVEQAAKDIVQGVSEAGSGDILQEMLALTNRVANMIPTSKQADSVLQSVVAFTGTLPGMVLVPIAVTGLAKVAFWLANNFISYGQGMFWFLASAL